MEDAFGCPREIPEVFDVETLVCKPKEWGVCVCVLGQGIGVPSIGLRVKLSSSALHVSSGRDRIPDLGLSLIHI